MTFIVLSLDNRSSVSYNITDATFVVESKKKSKRSVVFEKTLSEKQVIRVCLYEEGGQRNLEMTIDTKDINKAASHL